MKINKFEGNILDIGNDYYLVKKAVVDEWKERMENLQKDLEKMSGKNVGKKNGTVAGKEGRREVLGSEEKRQVVDLRKKGYSLRILGEYFKVSHETIRQVIKASELENEKKMLNQQKESDVFGEGEEPKKIISTNIWD